MSDVRRPRGRSADSSIGIWNVPLSGGARAPGDLRLPFPAAPDGLPGMSEQTAAIRRAFWVDPDADPRNGRERPEGETATLLDYLERYRMTFEMKCDGLTPEQLATRSVPPSTMSLLGLLRHLAKIEHHWFRRTRDRHRQLCGRRLGVVAARGGARTGGLRPLRRPRRELRPGRAVAGARGHRAPDRGVRPTLRARRPAARVRRRPHRPVGAGARWRMPRGAVCPAPSVRVAGLGCRCAPGPGAGTRPPTRCAGARP